MLTHSVAQAPMSKALLLSEIYSLRFGELQASDCAVVVPALYLKQKEGEST